MTLSPVWPGTPTIRRHLGTFQGPPILGVLHGATELQCTHPVPTLSQGLPPDWLMHTNIPGRVQCPSVPTPDSASPHCTPSLPPSLCGHRSLQGQGDTASPQCLVLPSPSTTLHLLSRVHPGQGSPCPGEATRDTQLSCVRWGVAGVAALGCGGCGRVAARC